MGRVVEKRGWGVKKGREGVYIYTGVVYVYAGVWVGHSPVFCVIAFCVFPCVSKHRLPPSSGWVGGLAPVKNPPVADKKGGAFG